jgi:hypothetical protein
MIGTAPAFRISRAQVVISVRFPAPSCRLEVAEVGKPEASDAQQGTIEVEIPGVEHLAIGGERPPQRVRGVRMDAIVEILIGRAVRRTEDPGAESIR